MQTGRLAVAAYGTYGTSSLLPCLLYRGLQLCRHASILVTATRTVLPIDHGMHEHVPNWKHFGVTLTRPVSDRSTLLGGSRDIMCRLGRRLWGGPCDMPAPARDVIRMFNILPCIKCVAILSGDADATVSGFQHSRAHDVVVA